MTAHAAESYWTTRLRRNFDLRGTGHLSYSSSYNRWVYWAKRRALRRGTRGLQPPFTALDVGCGTGWGTGQLIQLGATVEGCDIVEESVMRLGRRYPQARFFQVELGTDEIPREDSTYDLVLAFDVLYCLLSDRSWEAAVRELDRVLKPGGRMLVIDEFGAEDRHDAEHVRPRSIGRWTSLADSLGLVFEDVLPLHAWLARDRRRGPGLLLPGLVRGAVEYGLDVAAERGFAPTPPAGYYLNCGILVKLRSRRFASRRHDDRLARPLDR